MFSKFNIRYLEQGFWDSWNFNQYSDTENYEYTERFYDQGTIKDTTGKHDVDVYYYVVAEISKENYDEFHKRHYYYDIQVHCYVDWNRHNDSDPVPDSYWNAIKRMEQGPGSEDWDGKRAFYFESIQVDIAGEETIYDDYYKKQANDFIMKKVMNLPPREKPYVVNDHEGRPWSVTIAHGMRGTNYVITPLEGQWGIHGNSMPPMGITGNSMSAEFMTDDQKASIAWSTFRTIAQVMLESGGEFLENSNYKTIEEAMKAAEQSMLKGADSKKAKAALDALNKEMQKILGDRPSGGTTAIGENVLRQAQKKAMETAEAKFKADVNAEKIKAGKAAAAKGVGKATRGAALKMAGKALNGVNYGLTLIDITVAFAEVSKGSKGDPQAADKGMGAFVDLGVALVSTVAAAGAGAAAGAVWGATTGTVVGAAVGVILGAMWGVANYVCLQLTGVPLSQYLGGKINTLVVNHVAPVVQPVADEALRYNSGGMIDSRGFHPENYPGF